MLIQPITAVSTERTSIYTWSRIVTTAAFIKKKKNIIYSFILLLIAVTHTQSSIIKLLKENIFILAPFFPLRHVFHRIKVIKNSE